jgi:molybdopterin/thiamine biosynthesis adenylyltransferase
MLQYKLHFIPTSFVIIGAGGTGGRLVPLLSQFLKTVTWINNSKMYVVDNDVVEEKNLARQNFIKLDLHKPKAVVLAERYSKAFDITILPVVKRLNNSASQILSETNHVDKGIIRVCLDDINNAIIMLCVDSASARRDILNVMMAGGQKNLLFLDAGNENDYGQIQLFTPTYPHVVKWKEEAVSGIGIPGMGIPFDVNLPGIPFPLAFYDTLKDNDTRSCADLDQTLAINALMATSMMGIIQNLIYNKSIPFNKMSVSLTFGSIPEMMTLDSLFQAAKPIMQFLNAGYPASKNMVMPRHPLILDDTFSHVQARIVKEFDTSGKQKPKPKKVKKSDTIIDNILESIE